MIFNIMLSVSSNMSHLFSNMLIQSVSLILSHLFVCRQNKVLLMSFLFIEYGRVVVRGQVKYCFRCMPMIKLWDRVISRYRKMGWIRLFLGYFVMYKKGLWANYFFLIFYIRLLTSCMINKKYFLKKN